MFVSLYFLDVSEWSQPCSKVSGLMTTERNPHMEELYFSKDFIIQMTSSWMSPKKKGLENVNYNMNVAWGQLSETIIVQGNWRLFILNHSCGHFLWLLTPRNVMSVAGSGNERMCHPQNQCFYHLFLLPLQDIWKSAQILTYIIPDLDSWSKGMYTLGKYYYWDGRDLGDGHMMFFQTGCGTSEYI